MSSTTYNITPGRFEKQLPVTTKAHSKNTAATTNATLVKGNSGTVFNIIFHNTATAGNHPCHLRFYDLDRLPVVGTDVPFIIIQVGSGSSKEICFTSGINFTTGIAYSMTIGDDLLDATATEASAAQLYLGYM